MKSYKRNFDAPHEDNPIMKLTFEFALKIIELSEWLEDNKKFVIARQLLKSGTSIGANVYEAQNAESKSDFIHKLKIAAKEADETQYWLLLVEYSLDYPEIKDLLESLQVIRKMLSKIIASSKNNTINNKNRV
jgi:four helix bundle protein